MPDSSRLIAIYSFLYFGHRSVDEVGREPKSSTDINHHAGTKSVGGHSAMKPTGQDVGVSNSMLSSFVYGMPVSASQPHPENKEIKPISLHNLGKECLGMWMSAHEKATPAKDCADNGRNYGT